MSNMALVISRHAEYLTYPTMKEAQQTALDFVLFYVIFVTQMMDDPTLSTLELCGSSFRV